MALSALEGDVPEPDGRTIDPVDRCRFGNSFDQPHAECRAFQPLQFVAATSYGKPLRTHVTCAYLQVGDLARNQFYPRCSLGSDAERVRWIAQIGSGTIERMRDLNTEFDALFAGALVHMVDAKARVLENPPTATPEARGALAAMVRAFLADFESFVTRHAGRIEHVGLSPADVTALAAAMLDEWQGSARLDLPGFDEQWLRLPEE